MNKNININKILIKYGALLETFHIRICEPGIPFCRKSSLTKIGCTTKQKEKIVLPALTLHPRVLKVGTVGIEAPDELKSHR